MYCWICLPISSNALGLSSASVYLSMMGCPRFWSQWKLHVSKRRNCKKSRQVNSNITFNSASLSMYTCLGWSSPSSYSQFSVSSSFNDKASRSCMAHTHTHTQLQSTHSNKIDKCDISSNIIDLNKKRVKVYSQIHWQTSPASREACPSCRTRTLQHYS